MNQDLRNAAMLESHGSKFPTRIELVLKNELIN